MRQRTFAEALADLSNAIAAAGIAAPDAVRGLTLNVGVLELQVITSLIGQAWNNGYHRGSDDATLKAVYPPLPIPPAGYSAE